MNIEIAVLLNVDGQTSSFNEEGIIKIFSKKDNKWEIIKEYKFTINEHQNLRDIRQIINNMVNNLGECKVFVAEEVMGLGYTILEMAGFNIWEMEGKPEEFLDYILEKEKAAKLMKSSSKDENVTKDYITPLSGREGCYTVNLKKIQESETGLTSKQVIQPFIRNKKFIELEIICSHIPPWFEAEFENLNLITDVIPNGINEFKVTVKQKNIKAI